MMAIRFNLIKALAAGAMLLSAFAAYAEDKGQWNAYSLSQKQKAWFKTVLDSSGISCCAAADGYPVVYELRGNNYWVLFQGEWMEVPDHAVRRQENPVGEAVDWFWFVNGGRAVKCFVPATLY